MKYEYKMVQTVSNIIASRKKIDSAAADYLEELVNRYAMDGWEFFRIDDLTTEESAGCFSFGKKIYKTHKVITFRREKMSDLV
ncbi:DUF4177 domain-containing protein [Otariodibacter sp.]|uniref:DUF4177 domain-containing protein n=1 Tax=Otariodibacter sp. TaxID=3030919 RepID=UPI002621E18F|nr:DUF4177 domain-containing protein [Otariodibacter sp.]